MSQAVQDERVRVGQRWQDRVCGDVVIVVAHRPDRSCAWQIKSANPLGGARWVTRGELLCEYREVSR